MNCPDCNQPLTNETDACPSCGSTELPLARPDTSTSRPGWLVFLGVAAAVLLVGLGAWALTGSDDTAASLADQFPADAVFYLQADIAGMTSGDARTVLESFGPVYEIASGEPFDADVLIDEMLASFQDSLDEMNLSYEDDLASWSTGTVAAATLAPEEGSADRIVLIATGRDDAALDAFIAKLASTPEAGPTETIGGTEFLIWGDEDERSLVGRRGNDLLVATDTSAALALTSVQDGASLADTDLAVRLAELPAESVLTIAIDAAAATESAPAELPVPVLPAVPSGWTAGALTIAADAVSFEWITGTSDEFPLTFDDAVLASVPAETVALFRAGSMINHIGTAAGPLLGAFGAELGVPFEDVLAAFANDAALAVWPSAQPEIPVGAALVASGEGDQSGLVDDLAELASTMGLVGTEVPGGYSFSAMAGLGARDNLTILTTDVSLLSAPPATGFTEGELYDTARDLVDGTLVAAFDVPAVVDLVDGFVAADDPDAAEALRCLPFGVAAAGVEISEDTLHSITVVEISPRC